MCLPQRRPRISRPIDRSVPVAAETRREQEGQQHVTIEDCTTRRDKAAKKIRRLIEAVGGERRIRLQEGAEVPHDVTFWEGV